MIASTLEEIKLTKRDSILYITLNRPEKLNALTKEMSRELLRLFQVVSDDAETRVVVLTGAGRAFCVGGDLSLEDTFNGNEFQRELELYGQTVLSILSCSKPIICEINGDAVGWGATLALYSDTIIAQPNVRVGDPHVNVGLSTGDGASVIWPELAGYARAKQYLLTGDLMSAELAERYGIINEVVAQDRLRARVDELADKMASKPELAVAMTKASVNISLKKRVQECMDTYIAYELATQKHPDHIDAVNSFLNSRKRKSDKK